MTHKKKANIFDGIALFNIDIKTNQRRQFGDISVVTCPPFIGEVGLSTLRQWLDRNNALSLRTFNLNHYWKKQVSGFGLTSPEIITSQFVTQADQQVAA